MIKEQCNIYEAEVSYLLELKKISKRLRKVKDCNLTKRHFKRVVALTLSSTLLDDNEN